MATTLLQLRNRVRDRADLVADNFVLDATLTQWINDSAQELYDLLLQSGQDWFVTSSPVTVVSPAASFPVPTGAMRLHGLDRDIGGGKFESIKRGTFRERFSYTERRYVATKATVSIFPTTSAPGSYVQWYTPAFAALVADSDTFDGIDGWEEYIVVDVALKCRVKGEEDTGDLMAAKAQLRARVQTMAATRDASEAPRIVDVHADDEFNNDSW